MGKPLAAHMSGAERVHEAADTTMRGQAAKKIVVNNYSVCGGLDLSVVRHVRTHVKCGSYKPANSQPK